MSEGVENSAIPEIPSVRYQVLQQRYKNQRRIVKLVKISSEGIHLDESKWVDAENIDFKIEFSSFKNETFVPRQPLNIRSGPSIKYKKLKKVLTTKTKVTTTGKSFGDGWEVVVDGTDIKGWINSLWLARS